MSLTNADLMLEIARYKNRDDVAKANRHRTATAAKRGRPNKTGATGANPETQRSGLLRWLPQLRLGDRAAHEPHRTELGVPGSG